MINMQLDNPIPPDMAEARRPHLSANKKAGIETTSMRIEESPDARKVACSPGMPAWANKTGAY